MSSGPGGCGPCSASRSDEAHVQRVLRIAEEGERRAVAGVEDDAVVGRDVRQRLRQQRVQSLLEEDLLGDGLLRVLDHVEKHDAADEGAVDRGLHYYFTLMPGCAPESGDSKNMPGPSPEAASTMPSETPNFILRGARLATDDREPALEPFRVVGGLDARETRSSFRAAEVEGEFQQLVRAPRPAAASTILRDAEIQLVEFVDRNGAWHGLGFHGMLLCSAWRCWECGCGVGCRVSLLDFDERFNLLSFDTSHQMLVGLYSCDRRFESFHWKGWANPRRSATLSAVFGKTGAR